MKNQDRVATPEFAMRVRSLASQLVAELEREPAGQVSRYYPDLARRLCEMADSDRDRLLEAYCNRDWWGGAGSLADLVVPDQDLQRRIHLLLVAIVDAFSGERCRCPRAERWAEVFRHRLRAGRGRET